MVKSSASSVIMPKIGGSSISGIPLITLKKKNADICLCQNNFARTYDSIKLILKLKPTNFIKNTLTHSSLLLV